MRNKTRNNELVARAFELLSSKEKSEYASNIFGKDGFIDKAYASQIAAFSVSVAMVGLKPTLAMYYEQGGATVDTRNIIGIVAELLMLDGYDFAPEGDEYNLPSEKLFVYAMKHNSEKLRKDVIDNAVALKVVVRTFIKTKEDEKPA